MGARQKRTSEQANKRTSERGGKAIEAKQDRGRFGGFGAFCGIEPAFTFRVRGMIGLLCSEEQSG